MPLIKWVTQKSYKFGEIQTKRVSVSLYKKLDYNTTTKIDKKECRDKVKTKYFNSDPTIHVCINLNDKK